MTRHRLWFWGGGVFLFALSLWALRDMLLPFVIGVAVAYFLDPVVDRLTRTGLNRTVAVSAVLLAFAAAFALSLALALPVLHEQFVQLASALPGYIARAQEAVLPYVDKARQQFGTGAQAKEVLSVLPEGASGYAAKALSWTGDALLTLWNGGMAVFDILSILFIAPVVSFYMLRDWDAVTRKVDSWLPRAQAVLIRRLLGEMDRALSGFLRGQALVCLALGSFYGVALSLAGLDFGFFIGFAAGILSFIPYVGSIAGLLAAVVVAWFQYDGDAAQIMVMAAIFGVGQFLEGNFLTPKLVGEKVGLHALWVLFALMAGGSLLGFVGVMLAVPVAAVAGVLVRFFLQSYLQSPYYTGETPVRAEREGDVRRKRRRPRNRHAPGQV